MFALIISQPQRTPPENQAGSAIVIQVKSVQHELDENRRKRQRAENMIVSNPEVMRGTPVYRGTRIPVELIADMLIQDRRLQALHRVQYHGIKRFDIALLRDMRVCVAQNPLHDLLVRAQLVKVGCDTATKTMPPIPRQPDASIAGSNRALCKLCLCPDTRLSRYET